MSNEPVEVQASDSAGVTVIAEPVIGRRRDTHYRQVGGVRHTFHVLNLLRDNKTKLWVCNYNDYILRSPRSCSCISSDSATQEITSGRGKTIAYCFFLNLGQTFSIYFSKNTINSDIWVVSSQIVSYPQLSPFFKFVQSRESLAFHKPLPCPRVRCRHRAGPRRIRSRPQAARWRSARTPRSCRSRRGRCCAWKGGTFQYQFKVIMNNWTLSFALIFEINIR